MKTYCISECNKPGALILLEDMNIGSLPEVFIQKTLKLL